MTSPLTIWVIGCFRSGTNWVTTLCSPLVERVVADSDVTDNSDYLPGGPDKVRQYRRFASKSNLMTVALASEAVREFPASRFIRVVRDRDSVVNSMVHYNPRSFPPRRFNYTPRKARRFIDRWTGEHQAVVERFPDRSWTVRFEDLMRDFAKQYETMCRWLGHWDPLFLQQVMWPR